ncbi:fungal specific transcription factor domain-containing protein [Colletotrichum truncatum]|uniref:Fungal specific transcription factor domain-containing protein n=1 Tax=Colletotrichum truncatum TaxID=5467 RepID=A0ACC3Z9V8_COLTU|nr:fungal specific transcription factor domain-containing protein [Colletotrichum truncatum]KAF6796003.1 fungal specific transcription factor domain-containing protein [Colletotrichum truncatum]
MADDRRDSPENSPPAREGQIQNPTPAQSCQQNQTQEARPPPKKRRRVVISCTECHRRKQKCDRDLPCANCRSRNKQDACKYETGAPTAKEHRKAEAEGSRTTQVQSLSNAAANWGYSHAGASTLGLMRKIESANGDGSLSHLSGASQVEDQFATKERYKSLIRQLPAKGYIEKLVEVYFREFNWQYYALEEDLFMQQFAEWNNLPFNVLSNSGPQGLSPDLRVFPALLFQVLATALLILPEGSHEFYEHLKYAGNMTFEDLAADYSESGVGILSLLGKRQITLTTVQASFLRAAFLKYMAKVTESQAKWHAIGSAIRDAQEIGMHRDSLDPQPVSNETEDVLENMWLIQRRRKLYMVLMTWDIHCALVLGRPGSIDWRILPPSLPIDTPLPKDRRKTPIAPRDDEKDPPTPLTRGIWAFKLVGPMREILELEHDGPCPKDYAKVDRVHQMCMELDEMAPAYFRLENPDRRWDDEPSCYWLQSVRFYLPQMNLFNLMALHRPYIFNRQKSRTEALKASIEMLHRQMLTFQGLEPGSWRNFSLFFGSFDAVVLMASIYILFPKENLDMAGSAMQHFHWTTERFEAMQERNPLAKAAKGVLQAIFFKFKKAVGNPAPPPSMSSLASQTPASTTTTEGSSSSVSGRGSVSTTTNTADTPVSKSSTVATPTSLPTAPETSSYPLPSSHSEWTMPNSWDFTSIAPLFPMGDLIYHDLNGIPEDGSLPAWGAATPPPPPAAGQTFEGDFGNDSVWNILNQYDPTAA